MGLNVRLHARARADLAAIRDYLLATANPTSADRVRQHLREKILRLGEHPLIGITSTHPDIRILPPTLYPYRVYYVVTSTDVAVLHIRHTSRREPNVDELE